MKRATCFGVYLKKFGTVVPQNCLDVPPDGNYAFHAILFHFLDTQGVPIQPISEFRLETNEFFFQIKKQSFSMDSLTYMLFSDK